ncbi:hypothetical protein Pfo_027226 [Paulownia fortunei]|nr:hypothetical protein Pfo_027226 [Paulownia fortunei]
MGEPKNSVYQEEEEKNPIIVFFSNLLGAIKLPFPQKKNGAKVEPAAASSQAEEPIKTKPAVVEDESDKPGVVTFPRQSFVPLKLEAEAEEAERSTNPVLLWQVLLCFLGNIYGFLRFFRFFLLLILMEVCLASTVVPCALGVVTCFVWKDDSV